MMGHPIFLMQLEQFALGRRRLLRIELLQYGAFQQTACFRHGRASRVAQTLTQLNGACTDGQEP